jgi:hypothetical protein
MALLRVSPDRERPDRTLALFAEGKVFPAAE